MWPYAEGKAQFVREVVSEAGPLTPPSDMDALDGAPGAGEAPHAQHLRAVGAALTAAAPLHASIGGKLAGVTRAQLEQMLLEANATRGLPHTQEGRQARQAAAFADGPVIRALASLDAAAARRAATDIARFVRARRKRGLASAHSNRMASPRHLPPPRRTLRLTRPVPPAPEQSKRDQAAPREQRAVGCGQPRRG